MGFQKRSLSVPLPLMLVAVSFLALLFCTIPATAAAPTTRVMPLGDSITEWGYTINSDGYRRKLADKVAASGRKVEWVGSKVDNLGIHHEGIDGVHPNDDGFRKMADTWYPALVAMLTGAAQVPDAGVAADAAVGAAGRDGSAASGGADAFAGAGGSGANPEGGNTGGSDSANGGATNGGEAGNDSEGAAGSGKDSPSGCTFGGSNRSFEALFFVLFAALAIRSRRRKPG